MLSFLFVVLLWITLASEAVVLEWHPTHPAGWDFYFFLLAKHLCPFQLHAINMWLKLIKCRQITLCDGLVRLGYYQQKHCSYLLPVNGTTTDCDNGNALLPAVTVVQWACTTCQDKNGSRDTLKCWIGRYYLITKLLDVAKCSRWLHTA